MIDDRRESVDDEFLDELTLSILESVVARTTLVCIFGKTFGLEVYSPAISPTRNWHFLPVLTDQLKFGGIELKPP